MTKNNRGVILGVILLVNSLSLSAQKNTWTLGIYTGVQGQITTSVKHEYYRSSDLSPTNTGSWNPIRTTIEHNFSRIPPIELTVKYNIGNHFSIGTGVAYRTYYMSIKYNDFFNYTERYDYIQVPILLQYDIPLKKKGFSFFVQGGIGFDFEIDYRAWGYSSNKYWKSSYTSKTYTVENSLVHHFHGGGFNYLLHGGFGFSYMFDSGIGISFTGRYTLGARHINKFSYHTIVKEEDTGFVEREIKEQLHGKAECWNALLGVSYTFKNKKRE